MLKPAALAFNMFHTVEEFSYVHMTAVGITMSTKSKPKVL